MSLSLTGLSAFPLTPLHDDEMDDRAFVRLVERLVDADVDSITVLGSTGSYAYLSEGERAHVARLAVRHAGDIPVVVGVGALRTSQVLENVRHAEAAGASGILVAPMSYQPLTEDDVFGLFTDVAAATSLPVVVYDNPGTTHFSFSTELYARIAELDGIASIKIPGVPIDPTLAAERVAGIRALIPEHVTIGVSGDAFAVTGLTAGCEAWYSVIGGTLPDVAARIMRGTRSGHAEQSIRESARLQPLWELFAEFGSLRVTAAIAEELGLAQANCLPLPLRGLRETDRARVASVIEKLELE